MADILRNALQLGHECILVCAQHLSSVRCVYIYSFKCLSFTIAFEVVIISVEQWLLHEPAADSEYCYVEFSFIYV